MSKKKFVAILPALAILSLVGTGFSTWYFNINPSTQNSIDVVIEDYADAGSFQVQSNDLKLVLDQTSHNQKGVHFEGSLEINYLLPTRTVVSGDDTEVSAKNIVEINDPNLTFRFAFDAGSSLKEYVVIAEDGVFDKKNWGKPVSSADGVLTYSTTINNDDIVALGISGYQEGKEPQNLTDYEAMASALFSQSGADSHLNLTISANLAVVTE